MPRAGLQAAQLSAGSGLRRRDTMASLPVVPPMACGLGSDNTAAPGFLLRWDFTASDISQGHRSLHIDGYVTARFS